MIAGIDTNALIWIVQHDPKRKKAVDKHVVEMRRRAKILLHNLKQEKATVAIATMTSTEFLFGLDESVHGSMLAKLQEQFLIASFDPRASSLCAKLLLEVSKRADMGVEPEKNKRAKDAIMVATLKAANVNVFYSHDRKARTMAEILGMKACDLPTVAADLFFTTEEKQ